MLINTTYSIYDATDDDGDGDCDDDTAVAHMEYCLHDDSYGVGVSHDLHETHAIYQIGQEDTD